MQESVSSVFAVVSILQVSRQESHAVVDVRDGDGFVDRVDVASGHGQRDDGDAGPKSLDQRSIGCSVIERFGLARKRVLNRTVP